MFYVLTAWFTAILVIMVYFASLLGASERTLHHHTVFRQDAHPAADDRLQASSRSACAPERGSRRRPAMLLPYPVGVCMRGAVRSRRHHCRWWRSHPAWGMSCNGAGGPEPPTPTPGSCLHRIWGEHEKRVIEFRNRSRLLSNLTNRSHQTIIVGYGKMPMIWHSQKAHYTHTYYIRL